MIRRFLLVTVIAAVAVSGWPQSGQRGSSGQRRSGTSERQRNQTAREAERTTTPADPRATITALIRAADARPAPLRQKRKTLVLTVSGQVRERGEPIRLFRTGSSSSLSDLLVAMRKAREDREIANVVVRLSANQMGFATAEELRLGIAEMREAGKKTYGVVEDESQASYIVAAACEEVILPPSSYLMLYGIKVDAYFLRQLLNKIGVQAEFLQVGQYKSFGETFTQDDYTTPARQNIEELVDDIYGRMVGIVAESRGKDTTATRDLINLGPASPDDAKERRLVDRIAYSQQLLVDLAEETEVVTAEDYTKTPGSKPEDLNIFTLFSMVNKQESGSSGDSNLPRVAVVYAVGSILAGSSDSFGFGSEEDIYSDTFIKMLDEIEKDKRIKAVILRVNSPGGSAFASDLIWKKLQELQRSKPVVASLGDTAASGGYYIAMGANKIFAHGSTVTGSIGVVGGKVNLAGIFEKVGVTKTTVMRGEFANLYSDTSSFSPRERQLVERMMRQVYDEFISKAAEGRKKSVEEIDEVAQGRVWLGERAKTVGLVDEIGGMTAAIQEVKSLIGVKATDKVSLVAYPKEVTIFDLLQKTLGGGATARVDAGPWAALASELSPSLGRVVGLALSVGRMLRQERVLLVMPFALTLE